MSGKIVDARLAEKVKALRDEGKTQEQIAAELSIAQSTVSVILCESAWDKDPIFGVIGIQSGPRG
jgi:orotate phosphoribosyltransferase-like protein